MPRFFNLKRKSARLRSSATIGVWLQIQVKFPPESGTPHLGGRRRHHLGAEESVEFGAAEEDSLDARAYPK